MPSWVYLYLNPRIRAQLSYMLSKETVQRILDADSTAEVQNLFLSTDYGRYFENIEFTLHNIEIALRRHFFEIYSSISRTITGEDAKFFYAFLKKYDGMNLKTILRGLHTQLPLDDIMRNIVPIGQLGRAYYLNMAETGAISEAIPKIFDSGIREALEAAYPQYERTNELFVLESALDNEIYGHLWKIAKNWKAGKTFGARERFLLKSLLGEDIDFHNILITLRAIALGLNPEDFWLPIAFKIKDELKIAVKATAIEDAAQVFSQSPYYGDFFEGIREKFWNYTRLTDLETLFQRSHIKKCRLKLLDYPFQISIIYSFITLKFFEIHDLKIVLTGKLEGISPLDIQKLLVLYH